MFELPIGWATYAQLQKQLSRRSHLDDHTWGLEAGLDTIHAPQFSATTPEQEFRRAAGSASRKFRDHAARFLTDDERTAAETAGHTDLVAQVEASEALKEIGAELTAPHDLAVIRALATGDSYAELAGVLRIPEVSLRSKALRLRRRFAHLAP